jgi:hypothetical protein
MAHRAGRTRNLEHYRLYVPKEIIGPLGSMKRAFVHTDLNNRRCYGCSQPHLSQPTHHSSPNVKQQYTGVLSAKNSVTPWIMSGNGEINIGFLVLLLKGSRKGERK